MALQKSITLPNGAAGNYVRVGPYTWDPIAKESSAHLLLFVSAAQRTANPTASLCLIAKLRLIGAKFDQYLANSVLDGETVTVLGQLYAAAKLEPLVAGGGLTDVDLSDATNV